MVSNTLLATMKNRAKQSNNRSLHCAALVTSSGELIAIAHNESTFFDTRHDRLKYHAEARVLRKIPKHHNPQDLTLIVIRTNRAGNLMESKPCGSCQDLIEHKNIGKVVYSTE